MNCPKITLDTNCIINLLDRETLTATSEQALRELIRESLSNTVDIAITTRVRSDLDADKNAARLCKLLRKLEMFPTVGSVLRFDVSRWDTGDIWASPETDKLEQSLKEILFPTLTTQNKRYRNKMSDIDHLVGHQINQRDVFVTDDTEILEKSETLKSQLNIVVMSPKECVAFLARGNSK